MAVNRCTEDLLVYMCHGSMVISVSLFTSDPSVIPCSSAHQRPARFLSASMEVTLGNFPCELVITTQCNRAEVVSLCSEVYRVNSSMKSSVRSQSKNARVFSEGEEDGFENRMENRCDKLVLQSTASIPRVGGNDG